MCNTAPTLSSSEPPPIILDISRGVAVSITTMTGVLATAATRARSSDCAGVSAMLSASCPSPAVYVSVPSARMTVSACLAIWTASAIPAVEFEFTDGIPSVVFTTACACCATASTRFGHCCTEQGFAGPLRSVQRYFSTSSLSEITLRDTYGKARLSRAVSS